MGIGCRRDPLEANVWYVKAADQGDERAKHRIAAIRAAASGAAYAGPRSTGPRKAAGGAAARSKLGGQLDAGGGGLQNAVDSGSERGKSQERDGGEKKGRKWGIF